MARLPSWPIGVETDLFEHRKVQPHFINPCCFGEDFAAWLIGGLSGLPGFLTSAPIQEDDGWGFWATCGEHRFWVALSYVGDGPQEAPAQWMISADAALGWRRLFRKPDTQSLTLLRDRIRQLLASDSAIRLLSTD